jgi:hypothetical protein
MQSNTFKTKILLYTSVMFFLILSCNKKTDLNNQITLKLNSIDSKTKQNRLNTFDTIEIRIKKFGFPSWRFVKVGECVTDSTGSVKIKIDRTEEYTFLLGRRNYFGSETFAGELLKDGQVVNLEVFSIENR